MLQTGDIRLMYPTGWSTITGIDFIGGPPNTGALVNTSATGLFETGVSTVPGGAEFIRYAKVFYVHTGNLASLGNESLRNPLVYITNETSSNQVSLAPDLYYLGVNSAQTGGSLNRQTLPNEMSAAYFTGYTAENPLRFSSLSRGTVTLSSGNHLGFWVKLSVPPGLATSTDNSFNIALNGEIV